MVDFWRGIHQRQDGCSNFASREEGICGGIQPHDDTFLLVGIQNTDESNRKSTLRFIFVSIFRKIVIFLILICLHIGNLRLKHLIIAKFWVTDDINFTLFF